MSSVVMHPRCTALMRAANAGLMKFVKGLQRTFIDARVKMIRLQGGQPFRADVCNSSGVA